MKYKTIQVIDHEATGQVWRERRKELKISLREAARRMGLSASFVSDLELGRRNWTEELEQKFHNVLTDLGPKSFECLGSIDMKCMRFDCDFFDLCTHLLNIDIQGLILIVEETD